jgi:hypothetical protein
VQKLKKMELEIKHLAPYLPYQLTGIASFLEDTIFVVDTLNSRTLRVVGETKFGNNVPLGCFCKEFKPILRPKTDLNKEIIVNGEKHQMWLLLNGCKVLDNGKIENMNGYLFNVLDLKYSQIKTMLEFHIDIFDLIPQGIAIDINTLSANGS